MEVVKSMERKINRSELSTPTSRQRQMLENACLSFTEQEIRILAKIAQRMTNAELDQRIQILAQDGNNWDILQIYYSVREVRRLNPSFHCYH